MSKIAISTRAPWPRICGHTSTTSRSGAWPIVISPSAWQKWRRRRPHQLALIAMVAAVLAASGAALVMGVLDYNYRMDEARNALADGKQLIKKGHFADAATTLKRAASRVESLPGHQGLKQELAARIASGGSRRLAEELAWHS